MYQLIGDYATKFWNEKMVGVNVNFDIAKEEKRQ
jgi:hypothetical protein